jgi:hypothetical protein
VKSSLDTVAALVVGAAIGLVIAACVKAPVNGPRARLTDEITAKDGEIRQWRVDIGLRTEPPESMIPQFRNQPIPHIKRICPGDSVPPPSCDEICNLADAICDNAEDICRIANELGNDSWSKRKCDSAKASCSEAKQRCCDCKDKPADTASDKPAVLPTPSPKP